MAALLELDDVHLHYGDSHILHGVSLTLERGSVLGLLGRNGVGKTSTLNAILGAPSPSRGEVVFSGHRLRGSRISDIVRQGIAWVPQGHRVFPSLTTGENFELAAARARPGPWTRQRVLELFPALQSRWRSRGGTLSGGEQQMLAIARALVQNPDLILMDEPSEGLSPRLVGEVEQIIRRLNAEGCSILLVEQNLAFAARLASRVCILNKGAVVYEGNADAVMRDPTARQYLGVDSSSANRNQEIAAMSGGERNYHV